MKRILGTTLFSGLVFATLSAPAQAGPAVCGAEAADGTSARRLAAQCDIAVEILSGRTDRDQFFANPDGTTTLKTFASPQRVRKNGAWKDIDTKLHKDGNGRLAPKAAADVSFSAGGSSPFAISIVDGKRFELSWPAPLPAATIDGDTATYAEVLPGVDLAVTATRSGFTHVLVVKTAAAAANPALASIEYGVSGDVTARAKADGDIELVDADGKVLPLGSHAASMWDSSADLKRSTVHGPSELAKTRPVGTVVKGSKLSVIPDAQLLKTGVLPLYIDPVWQPMASTWVYANNANASWTPGEHARVGRNPDDGKIFRSFFTFPVTSLSGQSIQTAAMRITLDHTAACAGNTAYAYNTAPQTGAAGSRVTWSPALLTQLGSAWGQSNESGSCGGDQGDDFLNITSSALRNDLQSKVSAGQPSYGIGLCMCTSPSGTGESGTYQWMKFLHNTAQLVVTYGNPPTTPASLTVADAGCDSTIATTTPALKAQYLDPDTGSLLAGFFEWQELPSGAVNTVTSGQIPAGNYGSVVADLGTAADGKSFTWRVRTHDGTSYSPWSAWCNFSVDTV